MDFSHGRPQTEFLWFGTYRPQRHGCVVLLQSTAICVLHYGRKHLAFNKFIIEPFLSQVCHFLSYTSSRYVNP